MFNKKDLNQPVTLGDFIEFTNDLGDVVESIVDKKIKESTNTILSSNDALSKKLDKLLVEGSAKLARDDRQDKEIRAIQGHLGLAPLAF